MPNSQCLKADPFQLLGHSEQGRPLVVQFCGYRAANLRVFILAGQHGDESDAREAAVAFLKRVRSETVTLTAHIAVLADANPDGAVVQIRRNASHFDLNRDHLLLSAPETIAIHDFVRRWRPDLILDIHTYRPWRPELLRYDFVFPQDVMIDFPTNPAVRTWLHPSHEADLLNFLKARGSDLSIRCERYTRVLPSGIIRHSNLDICDARNGLALRFDVPTVLLEGRRSCQDDPPIFTPPHLALLHCIEAVIEWGISHARLIRSQPRKRKRCEPIPVRCEYSSSNRPKYMEMQSALRGTIRVVKMPGTYLPIVRTTRTVAIPRAYAVPRNLADVLEILTRQGFCRARSDEVNGAIAQTYNIESLDPAVDDSYSGLPHYRLKTVKLDLDGFVLFSTDQRGGRLLPLFLEPDSQFGPHRVPSLATALQPGSRYPVVRLVP